MPPKKNLVSETALPNINSLKVKFFYKGKKSHQKLFHEVLEKIKAPYNVIISKENLERLAKEYQFYINPNELTDKQKKDPKIMELPTELTSEVLIKTLNQYLEFESEERKKLKKLRLEGKETSQPNKESKTTNKKDSKAPVQTQEETQIELKLENDQKIDLLFAFSEFPSKVSEIQSIYSSNYFDLIFFLEEEYEPPQFVSNYSSILENQTQLFDRLRDFANNFVDSNYKQENTASSFEYSQEDLEAMEKIENIKSELETMRRKSSTHDTIRKTVFKSMKLQISSELSLDLMIEQIRKLYIESINLVVDLSNYEIWLKKAKERKTVSFIKEGLLMEIVPETQVGEEKMKNDSALSDRNTDPARRISLMNTSMDTSFDIKGSSNKGQAKVLFYYNRQLSTLDESQICPEILLEALIDQIVFDKENESGISKSRESEEREDDLISEIIGKAKADLQCKFDSIVKDFTKKPSNGVLKATDPNFPEKLINIINEDDSVSKSMRTSNLYSLQVCAPKAKFAFEKYIQVPGINRCEMPDEQNVDFKKLKANQSTLYSFCKDLNVTEVEIIYLVQKTAKTNFV